MEKIEQQEYTISIITVCLNNKDGLERTIKSVLSQTLSKKEFIIIDGASTDGTEELLKEYQTGINVILSEKDNGIYDAMNKGVKLAKGEWIICMNAGDVFSNENVLYDIFCKAINPEIKAIYSDFWQLTSTGEMALCKMDRKVAKVMHQSFIYRKDLHQEHGYYAVTHPYINSDLLFMLMIPQEQYEKTKTPISINACGGVSMSDTWCDIAAVGLKMGFRIISFPEAFREYAKIIIKSRIPEKWKTMIKKYILKRTYKR